MGRNSAISQDVYVVKIIERPRQMSKRLDSFRKWVFSTPERLALVFFLLCVPGYWFLHLILRGRHFLADPGKDILYSSIVGVCSTAWIYLKAKRKMKHSDQKGQRKSCDG